MLRRSRAKCGDETFFGGCAQVNQWLVLLAESDDEEPSSDEEES